MKADHLMPDKYMKNDKDLMLEELKVRAQPLPSVITVWHMHGWGIASQPRSIYLNWGIIPGVGASALTGSSW